MAADRWVGDGTGRSGTAVVEAPPRRVRRRRTADAGQVPPALPETAMGASSSRGTWLKALAGGFLLCLLLFTLLGYIQPVFKKNERIEVPKAVQILLRGGPQQERSKAIAKKEAPKSEPRQEREQGRKQAQIKRDLAPKELAAKPRSEMQALKNIGPINTFQGLGTGAGGGGILVSFSPEDEGVLRELAEHREYQERRQRIREGAGSSRGGGGGAGGERGGGAGGLDLSLKGAEGAFQPIPKYPPTAEKQQVEGWVKVRILVGITGSVEKVEILGAQPQGYFEEAVQETLPRWRYAPALDESGRPIEFWDEFVLQFRLEDAGI